MEPTKEKFKDIPVGKHGFYLRTVDDGDPHVYIRTDWMSLAALAVLLVVLGAVLF
jgi:hypothetical protein